MARCTLSDWNLETLICEAFPQLGAPNSGDALATEIIRLRKVADSILEPIANCAGELHGTPASLGFARLLRELAGGIEASI